MVHETPLAGMKSDIKFDLTPFEKGAETAKSVVEGATKPLTEEEKRREELLQSFRASMERVRERAAVEAVKPPGLINNSAGFSIYTKTLNTLVSREGSFKSTVLNVIAAALLQKERGSGYHFLGFSLDPSVSNIRVLIIDTEQDENFSVVKRMQSITRMAGYEYSEIPPNLDILPLVTYSLQERLQGLKDMIPAIRKTDTSSHLIVVLDIITDFLKDINDSKDSPEITAMLNKLANEYDCTFLLTIHEAKTTNGARGHIGSELLIKSRCVMKITEMKMKITDEGELNPVYKLSVTKNSFGKKGAHLHFSYESCSGLLRYATVDEKSNTVEPRTKKDYMELLRNTFDLRKPFTVKGDETGNVRKELIEIFGSNKDNTIRGYLRDLARRSPMLIAADNSIVTLLIHNTERPLKYELVEEGPGLWSQKTL